MHLDSSRIPFETLNCERSQAMLIYFMLMRRMKETGRLNGKMAKQTTTAVYLN